MSDLFPVEVVEEEVEAKEPIKMEIEDTKETQGKEDVVEEVVEETNDNNESPFIEDEEVVEKKPKKKRKVTEKQLEALARAREKSRLKRMKLAEARNAKTEAEKEGKRKKAEEKRKAKAEKKAEELAEIDAFSIVKDKKYSFTKDELNDLLDQTIDRHEVKRLKRKEQQKRNQQPNVAQPYPYAMPPVAIPQPYPVHIQPNKPPPMHYSQMNREQIIESRKNKQNKQTEDFMNNFFGVN